MVATPLPDDPEPPTEQAVIANPKEPKPTPGELLQRVEAELAEAKRETQLLLFDKEDLQQQIKTLSDELQQQLGETSQGRRRYRMGRGTQAPGRGAIISIQHDGVAAEVSRMNGAALRLWNAN